MTRKNTRNNNNQSKNGTNLWGMIRDVSITAINKGQFPLVVLGTIPIIFAVRLPSEQITDLFVKTLGLFKTYHIYGWVLLLACIISWFFNARSLRRIHTQEVKRISEEKKSLQQAAIQKKLGSSN